MVDSTTSPPVRRSVRPLGWWWAGGAALAGVGLALLFRFDPGQYGFYPRCMFHSLTGLNCPGCGGLRAAHQLLHGHLKAAFALNPLLIVVAPALAWWGLAQAGRAVLGRELAHPFKHRAWVWAVLAAVVVFGIVRNLPIAFLHPATL